MEAYNEALGREGGWATGGLSRMAEIVGTAAETTLRKRKRPDRKIPWSEETEEWFQRRGEALQAGEIENYNGYNKELKTSTRRDKRRTALDTVRQELDVRDKWLGLRWMKEFSPTSYSRKDGMGRHVPMHKIAEVSANYLRDGIWGPVEQ